MSAFGNNNNDDDDASYWPNTLFIIDMAASMVVNILVTGMIVFRILKATGVTPTSVEQNLGSGGDNKFRHIMFIIIESGMALFSIQLVRVVLGFVPSTKGHARGGHFQAAYDIVVVINQMLNVIIIRSVNSYFFCFANYIYLTRESHQR